MAPSDAGYRADAIRACIPRNAVVLLGDAILGGSPPMAGDNGSQFNPNASVYSA
jgi:hypothetical protein